MVKKVQRENRDGKTTNLDRICFSRIECKSLQAFSRRLKQIGISENFITYCFGMLCCIAAIYQS